jgi:hypothetical protein
MGDRKGRPSGKENTDFMMKATKDGVITVLLR